MKILENTTIFLLGGMGYVGLELLWRGYSHGSMFLAGGLCMVALCALDALAPTAPLIAKGFVGAAVITLVEFACGILVNRVLCLGVWDYSEMPLNLMGQICLPYFILWIPVAMAAVLLGRGAKLLIFGTRLPAVRFF